MRVVFLEIIAGVLAVFGRSATFDVGHSCTYALDGSTQLIVKKSHVRDETVMYKGRMIPSVGIRRGGSNVSTHAAASNTRVSHESGQLPSISKAKSCNNGMTGLRSALAVRGLKSARAFGVGHVSTPKHLLVL